MDVCKGSVVIDRIAHYTVVTFVEILREMSLLSLLNLLLDHQLRNVQIPDVGRNNHEENGDSVQ